MLGEINTAFNSARANKRNDQFIIESVLCEADELVVQSVIPGSDEELDDVIDVDSISDADYQKLDRAMEEIIGEGLDDDEIDELLDGDDEDDMDERFNALNALIEETANLWYDDENLRHPNTARRDGTTHQPLFRPTGGIVQESKCANESVMDVKPLRSYLK